MELDARAIPHASRPPVDSTPSRIRRVLEKQFVRRRTVLQSVLGAGMVVGLTALDLLPGRNSASAEIKGTHPWRWWSHCNDYSRNSDGKRTSWRRCNPGGSADVSGRYCHPTRYRHRVDSARFNACEYDTFHWAARCNNLNDSVIINAWVWKRGQSGGDLQGATCSDGWTHVENRCGDDYDYNTACMKNIPD